MTPEVKFTVSEFVAVCNQTLEYAFTSITVEGEVASFKVNQGKWVFFDLKDAGASVSCFMAVTQLNIALTDGMKVRVRATPRLTPWGKFSLTVQTIFPVGEGSIKKSFELLKQKLAKEGLFDASKKRPLPAEIKKIGVISSTAAAGYRDFLKILANRWGGLEILTANTQVQGMNAPEQMIKALQYFNQRGEVDVIALLRGGGSADDLAAFNDERLVRAIAASRVPVIAGIGHEVDESLVDLAADVRASTPSNAAERLTPDKQAILRQIASTRQRLAERILEVIRREQTEMTRTMQELGQNILHKIDLGHQQIAAKLKVLESLNPENVLRRGYAIVAGKLLPGETIEITTSKQTLTAEIIHVKNRN